MTGSGWWGEAAVEEGRVSVRVAAADEAVRVILEAPAGAVDVVIPPALAGGFATALEDALRTLAGGADAGGGTHAGDGAAGVDATGPAAGPDEEEPPAGPDPTRPWTEPLPDEAAVQAAHLAALEVLRPVLGGLPETAEVEALGSPTFRVATRSFAVVEVAEGCPVVRVKVSPEHQALLLRDDRYRSDAETGPHGWTSLRVDLLDDEELRSLVVTGYRFVAPDHLAADLP